MRRLWTYLKNLHQHKAVLDGPELYPVEGRQADVLRFFDEILRNGMDLRVKVTGRSMAPFLSGGETLTISQAAGCTLRRGDLVLFRNQCDLPVIHRILKIRKTDDGVTCFLTKGDALAAFDEEIRQDNVLGKVLRVERPLQSGKNGHMDMNSPFCRSTNFSIALSGLFRTHACSFLFRVLAIGVRLKSFARFTLFH